MNKVTPPSRFVANLKAIRNSSARATKFARLGFGVALGASIALSPSTTPRAQRVKESPIKVTEVASRTTGKGTVVSISADGPLTRAQTWQDDEGFHIVLNKGVAAFKNGAGKGVKVRPVGNSLELVVPVRPGSNVTVQPRFNRLDLVVDGNIDARQDAASSETTIKAPRGGARSSRQQAIVERAESAPLKRRAATNVSTSRTVLSIKPEPTAASPAKRSDVALNLTLPLNSPPAVPAQGNNALAVAASPNAPANTPATQASASNTLPAAPQVTAKASSQQDIFVSWFVWVLLLLFLGLTGFLFIRRRAARKGEKTEGSALTTTALSVAKVEGSGQPNSHSGKGARYRKGRPVEEQPVAASAPNGQKLERKSDARPVVTSAPAALFGAYRIDQEIGHLVLGQPHSIEVLASRAADDRLAIETSLTKVLRASESSEDARRRARTALEEYGFVARQSAALLLGGEAYERASAARALGVIKSAATLPFLLEALYDTEEVVRTEAVASLGAIGLPAAIGALLDMARRHPEIPASLLGPALSACSVESLDSCFNPAPQREGFMLAILDETFTGEITELEPLVAVEHLPEWLEDETLAEALDRLGSVDVEARTAAAESLAQYPVQRAVDALSAMAAHDETATVRATAVTSLGIIDHESVFAAILMAFVDEAREVRAAAARALSRLSFDRADAYVRVIETSDDETLRSVAQACIKAGLAAQAIERLASADRRQAYEAFSLLSLVAKAGETQPILEAVESHPDINVRLMAIRLLGLMYQPELVQQLRQVAVRGGVPEKVRTAILEAVYRADQPAEAEAV